MPDYAESKAIAAEVVAQVVARYPEVEIEWPGSSDWYHGTIVRFTPTAEAAAKLHLLVNYDESYSLHAGRFVLREDEPTAGSVTERAHHIAAEIAEVAENGIQRGWLDRLIGSKRDRVGAWRDQTV